MAGGIDVKLDLGRISSKIQNLKKIQAQAMPLLYDRFRDTTPVRSGSARAHTVFHTNVIVADYPYAAVLDQGRGFRAGQMRGSDQAPHGMTQPTKDYAKKLIPQLVQKIGRG